MELKPTILILGGTGEARMLASALAGQARYRVVSSLAGRTAAPLMPEGEVRKGGFGGTEGLVKYLRETGIALVVDATHPFAAGMSRSAAEACDATGLPLLRVERPPWEPGPGDEWRMVADWEAAAAALPEGACVLLTVGGGEIAPFLKRTDVSIVARMIEPPPIPVPGHCDILLSRPPFTLEDEIALMKERGIDVLVTKNAGGEATAAKLDAARALRLPVIMITRPRKPPVPGAATVESMLALIERALT